MNLRRLACPALFAAGMAGGAIAAAGSAAAAVPISILRSGHATVPVVVEGRGAQPFVLDTAAEGSVVYAPTAEAWDLPRRPQREPAQGRTGPAEVPLVTLPGLSLDGVEVSNLSAAVLPAPADGGPLNGIVGLDVIGGLILDFDYPRREMALLAPGTDLASLTGGLQPLAAEALPGGLLAVPVTIGGAASGPVAAIAVIGTGVRQTRISPGLARALGIDVEAPGSAPIPPGATRTPPEAAATGLRGVELGQVRLDRAPAIVADPALFETFGVADRPAIILGLDWLSSARMVIDFPGRRVWFLAPWRDRL